MANTAKLKGLMREKNITQRDLATSLKMDPSTLSRKLNNNAPFTVDEASEIANILGLDGSHVVGIFFNHNVAKTQQNTFNKIDNLLLER